MPEATVHLGQIRADKARPVESGVAVKGRRVAEVVQVVGDQHPPVLGELAMNKGVLGRNLLAGMRGAVNEHRALPGAGGPGWRFLPSC